MCDLSRKIDDTAVLTLFQQWYHTLRQEKWPEEIHFKGAACDLFIDLARLLADINQDRRIIDERIQLAKMFLDIHSDRFMSLAIGNIHHHKTGIEPFFSWSYFRKSRLGLHEEKVAVVQEWQARHPEEPLPEHFVTAMELTPEEHVRVQATIQRWVDSSISKTCNVPNEYTIEQTAALYETMYRLGCKGGTVYRDGSRDEQVLSTQTEKEQAAATAADAWSGAALKTAAAVEAFTFRRRTVRLLRCVLSVSVDKSLRGEPALRAVPRCQCGFDSP